MGCLVKLAIFAVIIAVIGFKLNSLLTLPPVPKLDENAWWGPGDPSKQDTSIKDFRVSVPKKLLADLQHRLENHRPFTPPLEGIQQQYGMNTNLLKDVVDFWKTSYNWTERQNYLNKYPHYMTNIQGLDIHFIRVKPENPKGAIVLPLLILHGWPGSVREFYEIIPPLTTPREDRDFVFEVIAPSLPGFGFSKPAVRSGLGAAQIAVVFKNFMNRLGFKKYFVQGGDFGAIILQVMSVLYPESILGFHSNMCTAYTPIGVLKTLLGALYPPLIVKKEHEGRIYPLIDKYLIIIPESGYFHIQATKPDTIGVGLTDSPVGLAAYILEKFIRASDPSNQLREDGGLKKTYSSYVGLLDNLMIYWITGSAISSARIYSETSNKAQYKLGLTRYPVTVPSACARFENDFYAPDSLLKEQYKNLLQLNDYPGGHFSAFEVPHVLANDIFEAVEKFINFKK